MNHKNIVINPTTSGISVDLDYPLLPDHANLVKKYRENLKLPDRPLDLNILFNAKLVALLTENDPMLIPIVKALQNMVEKIDANSPYFTRDLHESDGLLYMDGKLVIPFTLRNAMMKTLHKTHPGHFDSIHLDKGYSRASIRKKVKALSENGLTLLLQFFARTSLKVSCVIY